jgi:transglutaminase-like putative cysteine protease
MTVGPSWSVSDDPVLSLIGAERPYYLASVTYDHYTGRGWSWTDAHQRSVDAEADVFPGWTPDRPLIEEGFEPVTVTVQLLSPQGRDLYAPGFPIRFFAPTVVTEPSAGPIFGGIEAAGSLETGQMYDVTAIVSSDVTEAQLASAPTDYEPEVTALYQDTTGITDRTREMAAAIAATAPNDPYHAAKALATFLRSDAFVYDTSVTLPQNGSQDMVDYFLHESRRGFCTYYASAMVMMARSLGIPARLTVGYGPGSGVEDGSFLVTQKDLHAWAEIYFPGYGWQIFESTRSINPRFSRASGDPNAVIPVPDRGGVDFQGPFPPGYDSPTKLQGQGPTASFAPIPGGFQAGEESPTEEARATNGWIFLVLIGLAAGFGVFRWVSARRRFRFMSPGDRGWARLNLAARRAGIGRQPSETFYEYAGWLEAELPSRAEEIRTIADGKVWSTYSGRSMSERAIEAIERAWDRLRFPLTSLAIRRRLATFFGRPV